MAPTASSTLVFESSEIRFYATTRHPMTGEELTRVQTIQKLTRKDLVLKDEQGNLLVMERED